MDFTWYKAPADNEENWSLEPVEIPDELYSDLAKSDFSKVGISEAMSIVVDDEKIDVMLVKLTPIIRRCIELSLHHLLFQKVRERISDGVDISKEKYEKYFRNEDALIQLLTLVNEESYAYFGRP